MEEGASDEDVVQCGTCDFKKLNNPRLSCQADLDEHNLTHVPYRRWCRHGVRGRGKQLPRRRVHGDHGNSEYHMNLCLPGEELGEDEPIVLVVRRRSTTMMMATGTPAAATTEGGLMILFRMTAHRWLIWTTRRPQSEHSRRQPAVSPPTYDRNAGLPQLSQRERCQWGRWCDLLVLLAESGGSLSP